MATELGKLYKCNSVKSQWLYKCYITSNNLLFGEMNDRPAKLRRLEDIRRKLPYLSASALASLIKDFEDQGIPELSQRKHIQEAKKVAVSKHHAYGPLIGDIPMVYNDGSSKNMLVVNLLSWLQAALARGVA